MLILAFSLLLLALSPALLLLASSLVALPSASSHHIDARPLTLRYLLMLMFSPALLLSHSLLSSPPRPGCACVVTEHLSELVTLRSADDVAWLPVKLCYLLVICEGACDAGRHAISFDHDRSSASRGMNTSLHLFV